MGLFTKPGVLPKLPPGKVGLLVLDTTTFHRDKGVIQLLNSMGLVVMMILGGITGIIQPMVIPHSIFLFFFSFSFD